MMKLLTEIKHLFVPIAIEETLTRELYKAKHDLLKAEEAAELYTALTGVYKGRVARLTGALAGIDSVDALPNLPADLRVVTRAK
jgi:hypothetical protein